MSQQINLFNPAFLPRRELFSARNVAVGAGLSLLLVIVGALVGNLLLHRNQQESATTQAEMKSVQERVTAIAQLAASQKPSPALQSELDRAQGLMVARQHVLAILGGMGYGGNAGNTASAGFAEYLRGLARQSMNGLWLTKVVISSKAGEMQIKGRTTNQALVADYVERLNSEKTFAGHGFTGLEMSQGQEPVTPGAAGAAASAAPTTPVAGATRPAPYLEFELSSTPAGEVKLQNANADIKS
jgi:hypothetical protein